MSIGEIRIAHSVVELTAYLQETLALSNFQLEEIELADQAEWVVRQGVLSHRSGGFFHVTGCLEGDQEHLVLYQPQGAFNGLLVCVQDGVVYVLLQARVEPGNSGVVQYGPTIQSTPANYLRLHKGKKTPYIELFFDYDSNVQPLHTSTQLDLGKRYFQKTKTLNYVQTSGLMATEENMIWAPLHVAAEAAGINHFLNTDLRSMIGVFDWDGLMNPKAREQGEEVRLPVLNRRHETQSRITPITELNNWLFNRQGVADISGIGVSVKMIRTSCTNREVSNWAQPLMYTEGEGLIVLLQRHVDGELQVLVTLGEEYGISGKSVMLPSFMRYPEEKNTNDVQSGVLLYDVLQSEEGGRFYKSVNRYQVRHVEEDYAAKSNQVWMDVVSFKALLKTSNLVSIQLRCLAGFVVSDINPHFFQRQLVAQSSGR